MAVPLPFPEQNSALAYTNPLPCYRDGGRVISCWTPTPAEMQEIMNTGKIWLIVEGQTQPPLVITGNYPFDKTTH